MHILLELLIGALIGYFVIILYELGYNFIDKNIKKDPILIIRGIHFHHSLYGILMLLVFFFIRYELLIGAAMGIILRHTYQEKKFVFIDRI